MESFKQELQALLKKYPEISLVEFTVSQKITISNLTSDLLTLPKKMMNMDVPPPRAEGELVPGMFDPSLPEDPEARAAALRSRSKIIDLSSDQ